MVVFPVWSSSRYGRLLGMVVPTSALATTASMRPPKSSLSRDEAWAADEGSDSANNGQIGGKLPIHPWWSGGGAACESPLGPYWACAMLGLVNVVGDSVASCHT